MAQLAVIPYPGYLPSSFPMACRAALARSLKCSPSLDQPSHLISAHDATQDATQICVANCENDIADMFSVVRGKCTSNSRLMSIPKGSSQVTISLSPVAMAAELQLRYNLTCRKPLILSTPR